MDILENYFKVFNCPNSSCVRTERDALRRPLILIDARYRKGLIYKGTLQCPLCDEKFPIINGIPNLLPERIRRCLKGEISKDELTPFDREIVDGIEWSSKMVPYYHGNVVDPFSSTLGPKYIERYEDLYIDNVLDRYLKQKGEKVSFIEMGVGTGRYLIRYGARMLNSRRSLEERLPRLSYPKSRVCYDYRKDEILKDYYSYDTYYAKNLKLLLGIDFQEGMIEKCVRNLEELKLYSLFGKRILLAIGSAQYFNLALSHVDEVEDTFRVVTCVFQTLGNQKKDLQIGLLKTLKKLASPRGIIIATVFNKDQFFEFGLKRFYKWEVAPTVGRIRDDQEALDLRKKGILVTERGVYSQWFSEEDLREVFDAAGLDISVRSQSRLVTFEDTEYIDEKMQEEIKEVLIIAEAKVP